MTDERLTPAEALRSDHDPKCHLLNYGAGPGVCDCGWTVEYNERLTMSKLAAAERDCPVGSGESHVRQGIPRLAAEVTRLRADLEIAESRKSDMIQRLSDFARDCRDNWDCDPDAHTHGTLCRACEAGRVLTND